MKLFRTLLVFTFLMEVGIHCKAQTYTGIVIGNVINDSTGQVAITNDDLQKTTLSLIPTLAGSIIGNETPIILASQRISYLVFKVTSSSDGSKNIALELNRVGNKYYLHGAGKQFHSCYSTGSSCGFVRDTAHFIIGCGSGSTLNSSCGHQFSVSN